MKLILAALAVAALAIPALASAAPAGNVAVPKPKPWHWTTAQAAASLKAFGEIYEHTSTGSVLDQPVLSAKCTGKGKAVAKRYLSFQCAVTLGRDVKTFFVRVRPTGKGEPCWSLTSLAAVPAACLNPKGVRIRGEDASDGDAALHVWLGSSDGPFPGTPGRAYQGPSECVTAGLGFFLCAFGSDYDDPLAGRATVILLKSGPRITLTRQMG